MKRVDPRYSGVSLHEHGLDTDAALLLEDTAADGMTAKLSQRVVEWFTARAEDRASINHRAGMVVRHVLAVICQAENPLLVAEAHRIAFDFRESNADSMRKAALRSGVSPEALSKRVRLLQDQYGLGHSSSFNKSASAVAIYKTANGRRRRRTVRTALGSFRRVPDRG